MIFKYLVTLELGIDLRSHVVDADVPACWLFGDVSVVESHDDLDYCNGGLCPVLVVPTIPAIVDDVCQEIWRTF